MKAPFQMNKTYDVVFFDTIGMPYTGKTPGEKGLGGSEFQVILLAEELASSGANVLVLNTTNESKRFADVDYAPYQRVGEIDFCHYFILNRYSRIPVISSQKRFVWASDFAGPEYAHLESFFDGGSSATLVCLSEWQRQLFPSHWKSTVIPYMLPKWVYELELTANPKKFVYASAALKGLTQTLDVWREIVGTDNPQGLELVVCSPGYDAPEMSQLMQTPGVKYIGSIPFDQVAKEIASSAGLFYVNVYPETFCIVAALTEALKRRTHILCVNSKGGLPETIRSPLLTFDRNHFMRVFQRYLEPNDENGLGEPKDYRPNTISSQWIKLLDEK